MLCCNPVNLCIIFICRWIDIILILKERHCSCATLMGPVWSVIIAHAFHWHGMSSPPNKHTQKNFLFFKSKLSFLYKSHFNLFMYFYLFIFRACVCVCVCYTYGTKVTANLIHNFNSNSSQIHRKHTNTAYTCNHLSNHWCTWISLWLEVVLKPTIAFDLLITRCIHIYAKCSIKSIVTDLIRMRSDQLVFMWCDF